MKSAGYKRLSRPIFRRTYLAAEQILLFLQSRGIRVGGREGEGGVEVRLHRYCFECGDHKESSPCYVNLESGVWFCHACGQGGSMVPMMRQAPSGLIALAGGKVEKEPERQIDPALPEKWHKALMANEKYLERFAKWRCLDVETLREAKIGITNERGVLEVTVPYIRHGRARYAKLIHWPKGGGKKKIRRFPTKSGKFPYGVDDLVIDKAPGTSNRVVVVEGEFDRLVLKQAGVKNVVSTPDGAANARDEWLDFLEPFDEIVLAYDRDEEGELGMQRIAKKMGAYRCKRVEWPDVDGAPLKDATEFARAGHVDLAVRAIEMAEPMADPTLIAGEGIGNVHREEFNNRNRLSGVSTGFKKLDRFLGGGWRTSEVTLWTGFSGVGKSAMLLNVAIAAALQGVPVLIASFELTVGHTVRRISQRLSGKWFNNMTDDNGESEYEESDVLSDAEAEEVQARLAELPIYVLNHFGAFPVEEFVRVSEYAARRYGVKFVVLDHVHYMLDDDEDGRVKINQTMRELTGLSKRADISVHAVSHTRKPAQGQKQATGYDMLGSMRLKGDADNVLVVAADEQDPADEDLGVFPASVTVDKFRETSCRRGVVKMIFLPQSHSYIERGSSGEREFYNAVMDDRKSGQVNGSHHDEAEADLDF